MVHSSEWRQDNDALRLDSEYQLKAHRAAIEQVCAFGAIQFKDDNPEIIHPHEIIREYVEEGGVWFLRAQNVRPMQIDPRNQAMISQADADKLLRNVVKREDVLVTRTGANRGQCAFFDRDERAIASSHTFLIRPKTIDPEFLTLFLNTTHGVAQIDKGVYGAAQPEVAPYYLGNIWVPKISQALLTRLKTAFSNSKAQAAKAEIGIGEAEEVLLAALGLANWTPPEPLAYTARLSEYGLEQRLDAQFFQPKYQMAKEALERHFDLTYLEGKVLKGRTVPYFEDGTVPIIRSGDLSDIDDETRLLKSKPDQPIFYLKRGDVLISSIGFGSIGKVQVFDKVGAYGTVSEVTVIRQSQFNPYFLTAFFRSQLGQMQIERYITGATGQLHLKPSDVERFFVPDLPLAKQVKFEEIYTAVGEAKARAKALLEAAKRALEIAIEDGEPAAMAYLDQAEGAI